MPILSMTRRVRFAVACSLIGTPLVCGCGAADDEALTKEQAAALEAAVAELKPYRHTFPVDDSSLREIGRKFVARADQTALCDGSGVVSGLWLDADWDPVFFGWWFELGTGQRRGELHGEHHDGIYQGTVSGDQLTGRVAGPYEDRWFFGQWTADRGAHPELHAGEIVGRYQRRNETGGYFFGVWTECTTH